MHKKQKNKRINLDEMSIAFCFFFFYNKKVKDTRYRIFYINVELDFREDSILLSKKCTLNRHNKMTGGRKVC